MGHARIVAGALLLSALALSPAAAQAPELSKLELKVERLLRNLADPNLRSSALEQLTALGPGAREVLKRAAKDSDPDVRFNALYLLGLEDVGLRRAIRAIVEGDRPNAGSYPEAREVFLKLRGDPEDDDPAEATRRRDLRATLVRYALRQGRRKAYDHVSVALDLLSALIEVDRESVAADEAELVARLFDEGLGVAAWELPGVFTSLRWEVALPALRNRISGGSPEVAERAARTLGECTPSGAGPAALDALGPGLKHAASQVRYAAVRALGKLNVDNDLLLPYVGLTRDPHARVAEAMLRVGAERGLSVIREPAEQWAANPATPERLRLTSVICLGVLGEGSSDLLLQIIDENRGDLALAALWALGATGSDEAVGRILNMARQPQWEHENALYAALGHSGSPAALNVLRQLEAANPSMALFGYSRLDDVPTAVEAIMRFSGSEHKDHWVSVAEALSLLYARRAIETNPEPIREALATLYNSATGRRLPDRDKILEEVRRVGAPAKGPMRGELIQNLVQRARSETNRLIPPTLAQIAPSHARRVLAPLLDGRSRFAGRGQRWYSRELARALAIAGEPKFIEEFALPLSLAELEGSSPDNRTLQMNNVGIDYLYARDLENAALIFRQMVWCDSEDNIAAYNLACGASLSGNLDGGLQFLRRSLRNGYTNERHIRSDSDLNLLHGDPRFERIFHRLLLRNEVRLPTDPELHDAPKGE